MLRALVQRANDLLVGNFNCFVVRLLLVVI